MTNTTLGILAHVDAGKTTLSESILYTTGMIREHGRVDHGDAFLDTDELERKRGITIYSKSARFRIGDRPFTLLDTPGHADFSPEMERVLRVLDYAVVVISAPDGVTQQVRTIWKLLEHYKVPTLIFVNKMDQLLAGEATGKNINTAELTPAGAKLLADMKTELGEKLVFFGQNQLSPANEEEVAVCDEDLMLSYLEEGTEIAEDDVQRLIKERKLVPVYMGAALLDQGTEALLEGLMRYTAPVDVNEKDAFGGIVYKITRDADNTRVTWMKITSGILKVRDCITEDASEKINGIRIYSGEKYEMVTSAAAGEIAAVTGLAGTRTGDGLGNAVTDREELLSPIMTCSVTATDAYGKRADVFTLLTALRTLEEEEPMLHVSQNDETGEICIEIMGEVQTEILRTKMKDRFGLRPEFGPGRIVYKETIRQAVEGVGHFEPLRHYAEVHLLLEPGEPGSGIVIEDRCPPNALDKNWRNLIMTHLHEKTFHGVLTGAELTDIRISVIGGKAHRKHTVGGDFRQATYRAVRQGLMMAQNILLEPVLEFHAEIPQANVGRLLTDVSAMYGRAEAPEFTEQGAVIEGMIPAATFGSYAQELVGYTAGEGRITASLKAYEPCHNAREVLDASTYDPDLDRREPTYSVFCSHGAGTPVPWNYVRRYMHVDTGWTPGEEPEEGFLTDDYYTYTANQEDPFAMSGYEMDSDDDTGSGMNGNGMNGNGMNGGGMTGSGNAGGGIDNADGLGFRSQEEVRAAADHSRRLKASVDFSTREAAFAAEEKELKAIFERTYGPVKQNLHHPNNELPEEEDNETPEEKAERLRRNEEITGKHTARPQAEAQQEYLLIDGYNIIFAWSELKSLALMNINSARDKLLDIISNYAGYSQLTTIVVFDAYKVPGGKGSVQKYHNIDVVYTKEAETADLYIEKTAHRLSRKYRVTVATSDAVEQVIIFGSGALRLSARGLLERIMAAEQDMRDRYLK